MDVSVLKEFIILTKILFTPIPKLASPVFFFLVPSVMSIFWLFQAVNVVSSVRYLAFVVGISCARLSVCVCVRACV